MDAELQWWTPLMLCYADADADASPRTPSVSMTIPNAHDNPSKVAKVDDNSHAENSITRMLKTKGQGGELGFAHRVPSWESPWHGTDYLRKPLVVSPSRLGCRDRQSYLSFRKCPEIHAHPDQIVQPRICSLV